MDGGCLVLFNAKLLCAGPPKAVLHPPQEKRVIGSRELGGLEKSAVGHGSSVLPALFRSPCSPRVNQRRGKLLSLQRGDELSAFLTRSRFYQRGRGEKLSWKVVDVSPRAIQERAGQKKCLTRTGEELACSRATEGQRALRRRWRQRVGYLGGLLCVQASTARVLLHWLRETEREGYCLPRVQY